jgi:DNA-binding transcriptional LysR family regulator
MKTIPLNALRTFEAVATRLSFAQGAKALNVSPAAVSSQIRSLERRLNQPLFHRRGRQITLTETGRMLLPGVERGLAELRQAVQSVTQDRSEGVLNVSMMPSFLQKWLMPRLAEFHSTHPEIDLRINADNAPVNFEQTDFHAAIRFGAGNWAGLRAEKILDDWILSVCSPRLVREIGPIASVEELQDHDLLFVESEIWDAWFRLMGKKRVHVSRTGSGHCAEPLVPGSARHCRGSPRARDRHRCAYRLVLLFRRAASFLRSAQGRCLPRMDRGPLRTFRAAGRIGLGPWVIGPEAAKDGETWVAMSGKMPSLQVIAERCRSGRTGLTRNQVCGYPHRGFESHPLRQISKAPP